MSQWWASRRSTVSIVLAGIALVYAGFVATTFAVDHEVEINRANGVNIRALLCELVVADHLPTLGVCTK